MIRKNPKTVLHRTWEAMMQPHGGLEHFLGEYLGASGAGVDHARFRMHDMFPKHPIPCDQVLYNWHKFYRTQGEKEEVTHGAVEA